jgi:hypothetical protein
MVESSGPKYSTDVVSLQDRAMQWCWQHQYTNLVVLRPVVSKLSYLS